MAEHKLDLLGNAFDSLNEGLVKYKEGVDGNPNAYKFAVVHFAHFVELYFKAQVVKRHDLLLYKNPFKSNVRDQNTIGLWEAIQFLENEGVALSVELKTDLKWFKRLRNDIEHSQFCLEVKETRLTLGRLVRGTDEYNTSQELPSFGDYIKADHYNTFMELMSEYATEVDLIHTELAEEGLEGLGCNYCDLPGVAVNQNNVAIVCRYCRATDSFHECVICGIEHRQSDMTEWAEDENGDMEWAGKECEDRLLGRE